MILYRDMPKSVEKKFPIETTLTQTQLKKIDKLANNAISSRSAFVRKHLVQSLKLQDDSK